MRYSWKKKIAQVGLHCPSPTGIEYIEDNARGMIFKIHCAPTDESKAQWALRIVVRENKTDPARMGSGREATSRGGAGDVRVSTPSFLSTRHLGDGDLDCRKIGGEIFYVLV